jgi:hypothetical protein
MKCAKVSFDNGGPNCVVPIEILKTFLDNELESITEWAEIGEKLIVEIIEMSQEQLENLPEFEGW